MAVDSSLRIVAPCPAPRACYLVDGSGQFHRAFHAIRGLATSKGLPTNATYGFTTMLRKLLEDEKPEHMAVVFDPPGQDLPPRRLRGVQGQPSADGQGPRAAAALHPPRVRGAAHAGDRGPGLRGRRRDRDALPPGGRARAWTSSWSRPTRTCCSSSRTACASLNPGREGSGSTSYDRRAVEEKWGVPPERIVDVLALVGDSVDNIPGVAGHRRQGRARPGPRVRAARGRARRTPTR